MEENGVGFNYEKQKYQDIVMNLINIDYKEISKMKKKAFELYLGNFESGVVEKKMDKIMESLYGKRDV